MTREQAIKYIDQEVIRLKAIAEDHDLNVAFFNEAEEEDSMYSHVNCSPDFLSAAIVDITIRNPQVLMMATEELQRMGPEGMRDELFRKIDEEKDDYFTKNDHEQ